MARHEFLLIIALGYLMGTLAGSLWLLPSVFVLAPLVGITAFVSSALRNNKSGAVATVLLLLLCSVLLAWARGTTYIPAAEKTSWSFLDASPYISRTLQHALTIPSSALIDGILTGHDDALPYAVKQQFNSTGTRHITAVSGMNITILGSVLVALLIAVGLRRTYAMPITLLAIVWYVLMIGAPASAIRAGIMGSLLVIKQLFGRPGSALRLLIYASACMLMANPLLLLEDVGFQLSVLATAGIILLQPILSSRLKFLPEFAAMRTTVSTTIAAYLFTLPVISSYFGTISISAIPANVLIGPAVTWIFVLGAGGVILSWFIPGLAYILLSPANLVSNYVLTMVRLCAHVPYASIAWQIPNYWWSVPYYLLILLFIHKNSTTDRYFRVESEH